VTATGWVFMIVSVTSVWALLVWCYFKVLSTPAPESDDEDED
jgi:hypothetical protein